MLDVLLGLLLSGTFVIFALIIKFTIVFCLLLFKIMLYPFFAFWRIVWR